MDHPSRPIGNNGYIRGKFSGCINIQFIDANKSYVKYYNLFHTPRQLVLKYHSMSVVLKLADVKMASHLLLLNEADQILNKVEGEDTYSNSVSSTHSGGGGAA